MLVTVIVVKFVVPMFVTGRTVGTTCRRKKCLDCMAKSGEQWHHEEGINPPIYCPSCKDKYATDLYDY